MLPDSRIIRTGQVWLCVDHLEDEESDCSSCGLMPFVPVAALEAAEREREALLDALLSEEAIEAVIDYSSTCVLGADDADEERKHTRAAISAAIAVATSRNEVQS